MTISELIAILRKAQKIHGDLSVIIDANGLTYEPEWIVPVNDMASFDKVCLIITK